MFSRSHVMHRQAAVSAKPLVGKLRTEHVVAAVAGARHIGSKMVEQLDGPADVTSFVEDLNVKYEKVIRLPDSLGRQSNSVDPRTQL